MSDYAADIMTAMNEMGVDYQLEPVDLSEWAEA